MKSAEVTLIVDGKSFQEISLWGRRGRDVHTVQLQFRGCLVIINLVFHITHNICPLEIQLTGLFSKLLGSQESQANGLHEREVLTAEML